MCKRINPVLLVFLGLILLVAWLYRDYGLSCDEEIHLNYGDWIMAWYATAGHVASATTAESCKYYGGFADVVTQFLTDAGTLCFSWDYYHERHFLNALIGLVGVFYTYRLGRMLNGPVTGVVAATFLLLTPRWFGHMFDNPKDIPFASGYIASLYYILQPWFRHRSYDRWQCLKIGLALGAALGTRIGGVFLYPVLALSLVLWRCRPGAETISPDLQGNRFSSWLAQGRFLLPRLMLIWLVSWFFMLLFWPYGLISPLRHPLEVMLYMSNNPWNGKVFFAGQLISSNALPPSYVPTWLLISLPEFYFLGLATGLLLGLRSLIRHRLHWGLVVPPLLVLFSVVLPALVIILRRSPLYDGMRHVMFFLPPLAILSAMGVVGFWREFSLPWWRYSWLGLHALLLGAVIVDMVNLHPYENIYFNRLLAGGIKLGLQRFDGDYWGQTYQAGAEWIVHHYPTGNFNVGVPYMAKRLGYYFDRPANLAARRKYLLDALHGVFHHPAPISPRICVLGSQWNGVDKEDGEAYAARNFRFYLSGVQSKINESVPGKVLYAVRRDGVVLLEVKEVGPQCPVPEVR